MKKWVYPIAVLMALADLSKAQDRVAGLLAASSTSNNIPASIIILDTSSAGQSPLSTFPINGSSGSGALRFSGSSLSSGYLSNSADRTLVVFSGSNSTLTAGDANSITLRGVGTVNATGLYTLATTYSGVSGAQPHSATTLDNSAFYIADQQGLYTNGGTAPSPAGELLAIKTFGGSVYASCRAAPLSTPQILAVPAPSGGSLTGLPGLAGNDTLQDFCLAQSGANGAAYDILYVLSARSATRGAITKYLLMNNSWTSIGTYFMSFSGFGLTAQNAGSKIFLYVSTGLGALDANSIIRVTDPGGFTSPFSVNPAFNRTLYTAAAGSTVKGIALGPVSIALPVHLSRFSAVATEKGNEVNWEVDQDDERSYYELEKSVDAKSYNLLGKVMGNTSPGGIYKILDSFPDHAVTYYRLKVIDGAGNVRVSPVASVSSYTNHPRAVVSVSPNPVTDGSLVIAIDTRSNARYSFTLLNSLGCTVMEDANVFSKDQSIEVRLPSSLMPGEYFVLIRSQNLSMVKKILLLK